MIKSQQAKASAAIQAEALRRAEILGQRRSILTGFGSVTAIENELLSMACFAIGQVTGQEQKAKAILAEADKEANKKYAR